MTISDFPETKDDDSVLKPTETVTQDVVFGEITEDGPNYRNVSFPGTIILMMKTQIGLGVLSIPMAFDYLGIVPGVICLCAIAVVTTWSDYVIGTFKLNHREVYGIDDAAALIFGPIGRWALSVIFCLYWVFVSGSGILGISIGLNALSTHGTCTAVFSMAAAILGFCFSSVRTLGRVTWLAWIGLPCILVAVMIVTIAVALRDRPAAAPMTEGPWVSDVKMFGNPSFTEGVTAVCNLVFAFSGTPGFFAIISEMRNPRQYTPAMLVCQGGVTTIYSVVGCVVYYYCGSYVSSPALGSAGGTIKQIAYGFALPGLIVTTTIVTHVRPHMQIPAKYIFVHLLRGSRHLNSNSLVHWGCWLGCTFGVTVVAYIIASSIPIFDSLVSLIGSLLGTILCFQPYGCMWLYDNWGKAKGSSRSWLIMVGFSIVVIVVGLS
ncbi:unnamed protein product [Penicillium egyptiacum]|uniref:Amino acid transporter transmembrane domain-containing protein n=1 Tax=Penicillium egyptiacum TaxID=1303716 RepID=A0A9W4KI12_9EURO|nr:unnamed protein product [Penicillium egyptiacum]